MYFVQKNRTNKSREGPRDGEEGREESMCFSEILKIILKNHFSYKNSDNFDNFD